MLGLCCCSGIFSSCDKWGLLYSCGIWASHRQGFSWQTTGSRHAVFSRYSSWALEHHFTSCGAQVELLHGMWDLPAAGIKPVSPVLADGFLSFFFLTTEPPGKPELFELLCYKKNTLSCTQTLIGTANKSFTEKYLSKLTSECEMHFGLFINKNAGREPLNWCYGHK